MNWFWFGFQVGAGWMLGQVILKVISQKVLDALTKKDKVG